MPNVRTLSRSFARGEISPEALARVDLAQVQTGLQICRNFIVLPHGPIRNRAGTIFCGIVKNSASLTRVIRFSYNNQQTFCIELGAGYFRFYTTAEVLLYGTPAAYDNAIAYTPGQLVTSGGSAWYCIAPTTGNAPPNATYWYQQPANGALEVPNPYLAADLADIHYVQSADVMTLTHPNYPPAALSRVSATMWTYGVLPFAPSTVPPSGVTATATTGSGSVTYTYVVTTLDSNGFQESLQSATASCTNDLTTSPNLNTVTWSAAVGETANTRYNVYKLSNGLYTYIGQAGTTHSFVDQNIVGDATQSPPLLDDPFTGPGTYPAEASYSQQRKFFAASTSLPQQTWATRSATEGNLTYSIPSQDDDRLSFRIDARDANAIRHIVPMAVGCVILTASSEWLLQSTTGGALTPSTLLVQPQTYIGANNVQPVVVTRSILYPAARGGRIRELIYQWQVSGYVSNDLCILASHLFDYNTILDLAFVKAPYPILWAVSSTGDLLGLTYVPEQQVAGWHRHDTAGGIIESICTVEEGQEDVLYMVVNRTINSQQVRYIECFHTRDFVNLQDAYFVDCGATFTEGAPVTTVAGLTWLEGQTVSILADGAVQPRQVVTSGTVTIPNPATVWQIGIPITAQMQTIPLVFETMAEGQGRAKNINKVWPRVATTSGVMIGPDFNNLTSYKQRMDEPYGSPPAIMTGELQPIVLTPEWGADGSVCMQQTDPLPITIDAITFEASIGA